MATRVTVPELGEGVDSVDVVSVLVQVGDRVEADQGLVEVETDKAAVEIPSSAAGTVTAIHVSAGDSLKEGDPIVSLDADESQQDANVEPASARESDEPAAESETGTDTGGDHTVAVPELGEGVDAVDVVSVLVEVGQRVEVDQGLVEVETDKAAVEVPSPVAGTVAEIHVSAGDSLKEGDPIVRLSGVSKSPKADPASASPPASAPETSEEPRAAPTRQAADTPEPSEPQPRRDEPIAPRWSGAEGTPRKLVPAAPTVRRFAREVGVDIAQVAGTGPGGRITIDDVKLHAKRMLTQVAEGGTGVAAAVELPDMERFGPTRREAMSKVRRLTAENLHRAWVTAPQVTNHDLADVTELEEFRQRYKERVKQAGGGLTITSILVKIVASAMKRFPTLNASVDMANHEIVFKGYVHVGVAVDTDRGLLVPVIRDADRKNITDISVELGDLAARARDRKLKPDEMQGASFTISNLGGIGGTGFSPIVNWPEVAILGVSRGRMQPEWIDGAWQPRLMLPLSLSYDHRLVDGADAARFLRWVAEALESPLLLSLEG
jgi:pyruvate dehydrogenase E2 component (dihydrolipoamide acetyltransferase)